MLLIELWGQISRNLSREDYECLRSSSKNLYKQIDSYDSSYHLTNLQEIALFELMKQILHEKKAFVCFVTPPLTGASVVLVKMTNLYLRNSLGRVVIICSRERRSKLENQLKTLTDYPFEISGPTIDTGVRIHLVISWTTSLSSIEEILTKNDLVIIMDSDQNRYTHSYVYEPHYRERGFIHNISSKTSLLIRYPDMINYTGDLVCTFKPHIVPAPEDNQEVLRIHNLYQAIDYLMTLHNKITIVGGQRKRIEYMNDHVQQMEEGRYHVTKEQNSSLDGKSVVIHDGRSPLSGIILIRAEKGEAKETKNNIYTDYSFLNNQRVYWHIDNGKMGLENGKSYASTIFKDQIKELIYNRFFSKEIRWQCRDYIENKELNYITSESTIQWNSKDNLQSMLSSEFIEPMSYLLDKKIRY